MSACLDSGSTDKVIGVILCGGKSTRMGRDKATLRFRGVPMLDHASDTLTRALRCRREDLLISGIRPGYRSVSDRVPELGPIGGLWSVARHVFREQGAKGPLRLLVIPVDMPCLRSEQLARLCNVESANDAVTYRGYELPLLLSVNFRTLGLLRKLVHGEVVASERSIRRFLETIGTRTLEVSRRDEKCFRNTNTLKDWLEVEP